MEAKLDMDAITSDDLVKAPEVKTGRQGMQKATKEMRGKSAEYTPVFRGKEETLFLNGKPLVNCLRNVRVQVKLIPKTTGLVQNPKHILGGGMAESAVKRFTVPMLRSGIYKNVLTAAEKAFLEYIMGLDVDALSVYRKKDNYWANYQVRLEKYDNYLDLSVPEDYIKYKVLLANKDFIAPSQEILTTRPKATYQFVIIEEGEQELEKQNRISKTEQCYLRYGEIKNDVDILRVIVEELSGKTTAPNQRIEFLQGKCYDYIQSNPTEFLRIATDPYLDTKVLIKKAIEAGLIYTRGNYYYLRDDNSPLCGLNEEPLLPVACAFLNLPKNSQLKLSLEAKVSGTPK